MANSMEVSLLKDMLLSTFVQSYRSNPKSNHHVVEEIVDSEFVPGLCPEWERLSSLFPTPLLTYEWFVSCAKAFCPPVKPRIITIRSSNELMALAPLGLHGKFLRRLELLGSSVMNEPGGFLFKDETSLSKLIDTILDVRKLVYLKGIRFASPESRILEETLRRRRMKFVVREERLPWVVTRGKWEEFEKQISSSRRSSLRRLQRLAEAKGKVEFEVAPLSSDKINDYLTELFEVEAASWKGRTGTAMKSYKSLGQFFRYYSALESERGNLRLFFLRVNGKAIAAQLTVVHANRLWVFKIGHDESWSSCSPGILLMHNVIRYCFDEGLESCEMLGSDEPWLHIWGNEVHSVLTYRIYPRTFDAVIDLTGNFANMFIYKLGKKLAKKR